MLWFKITLKKYSYAWLASKNKVIKFTKNRGSSESKLHVGK